MLGEFVLTNMVDGINKSRAAIWLLTPAFINDNLCINAANFTMLQYGAARNLIVEFGDEERVDINQADRSLMPLLNPRFGVPRIKFTLMDREQRYFKERLQRFLLDDNIEEDMDTPLLGRESVTEEN